MLPLLQRSLALIALTLGICNARPVAAQTPEPRRDTTRLRPDTIRATALAPSVGYLTKRSRTATRTDTPLLDVPQAVSVVDRSLMHDRAMRSLADVVRYLPGIGMSHGEGNRDAPVLRGNTSTGDLFVDGLRDDVQYFRDLYNVERVEAIKGPNAMIFGRGGAGGILNRVTKQADGTPVRGVELQGGAWNERRVTGDIGDALTPTLAARVTGVLEQDDSFRAGVTSRREGLAPTVSWQSGPRTSWRLGVEHFRDARTADRGVPSQGGAPLDLGAGVARTFFGDPDASRSAVTARLGTVALTHAWANATRLESRLLVGAYDKSYQNVYAASAVDAAARTLQLGAYRNATTRLNAIWQTDLTWVRSTGPVSHRLLAGLELARQATENVRETGYFGGTNSAFTVPVSAPTVTAALGWRPSATDASNAGVATTVGLSLQDQVVLLPWLQAVIGLRVDQFQLDMTNRRTDVELATRDLQLSPRLGLIVKPAYALSLYGSASRAFVPRGGDQLSSLTLTNQALAPESFDNLEVGAKWEVRSDLVLTAALYELDRSNVIVPDPLDVQRSILAAAQRTRGLEIGLDGQITDRWRVAGGYALQSGRFTQRIGAIVPAGSLVANLPRHTISVWQRVELSAGVGVGLGVQHQTAMFAASDNAVRIPGFTRVDGALYARVGATWSCQLNVENLLDARYIVSANNNNNLMPAAPRMVRALIRAAY